MRSQFLTELQQYYFWYLKLCFIYLTPLLENKSTRINDPQRNILSQRLTISEQVLMTRANTSEQIEPNGI